MHKRKKQAILLIAGINEKGVVFLKGSLIINVEKNSNTEIDMTVDENIINFDKSVKWIILKAMMKALDLSITDVLVLLNDEECFCK